MPYVVLMVGRKRVLAETSAIERGEKDVRLSTLLKVARTLGVSLSQWLKGD